MLRKLLCLFVVLVCAAGCGERSPSNDAVFNMGNKCTRIPSAEELKASGYAACNQQPAPNKERAQ